MHQYREALETSPDTQYVTDWVILACVRPAGQQQADATAPHLILCRDGFQWPKNEKPGPAPGRAQW